MTSVDHAASVEAVPGPRILARVIGPAAVVVALLSALATFLVLAGLTPIPPVHSVVVTLLMGNAVAVLLLIGIIGRELWQIVQARRTGRAGARLHVRIIALFSIIAAAPAILVSIVASITLDRGLDRFFAERTRAAIANSLMVATAYVDEHAHMIRADVMNMAIDTARLKSLFDQDRTRFRQYLTAQANVRGLQAVLMLDGESKVVDRADISVQQVFVAPPADQIKAVPDTEPQVRMFTEANYVAAVIRLRNYDEAYLYVARLLDPRVMNHLQTTRASVLDYETLEARRAGVQVAFALMYAVIALIVLLSAVWIGLNFAKWLVAPIRRLIGAANLVTTGNLYVQVPVGRSEGDLGQLGQTFNKMTQELRTQRDDLVRARDVMDSRRRFTEAVLAGASAGVIGVDALGFISILNRSAEKLIGHSEADVLGKALVDVIPELAEIMENARSGPQRLVQGLVTLSRNSRERNLSVRVTSEHTADPAHGYVVTLDDITELVLAQRTSAWADVARRIAHEIKNPLTPIQLSAERLRRKYLSQVGPDTKVFEQCTDTIVRQVEDIKRMVDEFSRFARMPKPVMSHEDVADTVRQAVFLMNVANADIDIEVELGEDPMPAHFDRRLISQGLTNIIKNATEAITAVPPEELGRGKILVAAARDGDDIVIDVVDNGIGLPKENRNRLLEPYVTTREKGTGLGLAIVGRILEDHGGQIELRDAADRIPGQRGAWMRLRFAAEPTAAAVAPTADKRAAAPS